MKQLIYWYADSCANCRKRVNVAWDNFRRKLNQMARLRAFIEPVRSATAPLIAASLLIMASGLLAQNTGSISNAAASSPTLTLSYAKGWLGRGRAAATLYDRLP
jgi:hypothetical protein